MSTGLENYSSTHDQILVARWRDTLEYVADLTQRSGRDPKGVRVVAVSKKQSPSAVRILAESGQLDFGENYVQEALDKQASLASCAVRWHFLGRLQRNKAKFIPGKFVMLHSLDSLLLARALQDRCRCEAAGPVLEVLIQVNLGQEAQKGGVAEANLEQIAQGIVGMANLSLKGLMVLPPFKLNASDKQRVFAKLANLRDWLKPRVGLALDELSMGTSDDFPQAIAQGATLVRIGTRIFGPRAL
jgi:pyridoxal phosphate enzyme (YggS family)